MSQGDSNRPEKENVNIYDNDDAYMLNEDKENNENEGEEFEMEEGEMRYDCHNQEERENSDPDQFLEEPELGENFDQEEFTSGRGEQNKDIDLDNMDLSEDITIRNKMKNDMNNVIDQNTSEQNNDISNKSVQNLITLKYISVCQSCKENFDSSACVPYLLKCGHFFCRKCIVNSFTTEDDTIFCPEDGIVANSIRELKLLNNLIVDKTIDNDEGLPSSNRAKNFCQKHPDQKLSHFVEDTREVICVYCAFEKFKKNPKYEIKEIKEKCTEILDDVDKVLNDNQSYVETLQQALKDIKDNKTAEDSKTVHIYDEIIKYLESKKAEILDNINNIFVENADKLSAKLEYFSKKMERAENLKSDIYGVLNEEGEHINDVLEGYMQFTKEVGDPSQLSLELTEFKFAHDDDNKMIRYLNNFGDLKSKNKFIRFAPKSFTKEYPKTYTNEMSGLNYQLKQNLNLNPTKVSYERNRNKYSKEILNTSDLLNENNEHLGRVNTQYRREHKNYLGDSKDLLSSDHNLKPSSSKVKDYTNPRVDFSGASGKYQLNRNQNLLDYSQEGKVRNLDMGVNKTPDAGRNYRGMK